MPKLKEINEILKTEKIEGISEADIDLFNSVNTTGSENETKSEDIKNDFIKTSRDGFAHALEFPVEETQKNESDNENSVQEDIPIETESEDIEDINSDNNEESETEDDTFQDTNEKDKS